ncbi:ferric reductase-like transmembrane domain-containing protein [Rhodococcus sp. IEGM 1409]|uniref:ferric reductase-like transmembrane domain-containing protein n=1 Tax=Rhodococcus sp. IEGM 1409 TaxID=3047082 RepID=UPI0024B843A0|nr:ferric reductase-like transmembrane domain-containing protein [Rhodococcus sp. IEGM 1409]MDI9903109.1 ferric reductase-like transmembrane domain-containing protein [Rhodococcus sp. IEGM 1409]
MDEALWALGRGTGITALVFLTVSMVLGIVTRSGRALAGLPRFGAQNVHKAAALIGVILVVVPMLALLADPYAQLKLVDFVFPFLGDYRAFWLGLGTLAFDVLFAVSLTGLLRNRIGNRTFRLVHWSAYALWPIAFAHGLENGTDSGHTWFLAIAIGSAVAVTGAVLWRLRTDFVEYSTLRLAERT